MQNNCVQNRKRKRSKRRAIYCPVHGCYLDSVSPKYRLFADTVGQLQTRGIGRQNALILLANQTAVSLEGEWLEALWCAQCQETKWYHIKKIVSNVASKQVCTYDVSVAPLELWQQAIGVIYPDRNPSVGEFTSREARMLNYKNGKIFE